MKFKRLLTAGLMALFCAGTATAASQLNSVQVTPTANTATINLRTTGSYAHKEYRLDEHSDDGRSDRRNRRPAVEREVSLNSAVLKSYKISRYTSASGSEVTRIAFALGDQVTADVNDVSTGLQVLLTGGAPGTTSGATSSASLFGPFPTPPAVKKGAVVTNPLLDLNSRRLVSQSAAPAEVGAVGAQQVPAQPADTASRPVVQTEMFAPRPLAPLAAQPAVSNSLTPVAIRRISVRRGQGTMDVIIDGPTSAHSFLLRNPDRLVLDINNAVVQPSVRNIAVHTKDVLEVRVGRFSANPPVTRIVIDLGGPRTFDVLPSANRVIVAVKTEVGGISSPRLRPAPSPTQASAVPPPLAGQPSSGAINLPSDSGSNAAMASASRSRMPQCPLPPAVYRFPPNRFMTPMCRLGLPPRQWQICLHLRSSIQWRWRK